jgi:hypothetical protein
MANNSFVPTGIFDTLDEDTILAIQAKAVSLILEGKTLMQWAGEGTEARKQFTMSPNEILQECKYSLKQIDPQTYGHFIRKTKPFFGGGWWWWANKPTPPPG